MQQKNKKILTKQLDSIPSTFLVPLFIQQKKKNNLRFKNGKV